MTVSKNTSVWLGIADVVVSHDFQMREKLSKATVDEYAELISSGEAQWPFSSPCTVYRVKDELILVDGFHRVAAVAQAGEDQIEAIVIDGSKTDALKAALSANITHGLRRSNDDKRRAVTIALGDSGLVKWSDSKLAELCGVSHPFVGQVRGELVTVTGSPIQTTRTGADGKQRPSDKASQFTQREKIVAAVVANESDSDREIAKMIGCDHKTVGSVRRELANESSQVAVVQEEAKDDQHGISNAGINKSAIEALVAQFIDSGADDTTLEQLADQLRMEADRVSPSRRGRFVNPPTIGQLCMAIPERFNKELSLVACEWMKHLEKKQGAAQLQSMRAWKADLDRIELYSHRDGHRAAVGAVRLAIATGLTELA